MYRYPKFALSYSGHKSLHATNGRVPRYEYMNTATHVLPTEMPTAVLLLLDCDSRWRLEVPLPTASSWRGWFKIKRENASSKKNFCLRLSHG